MHTAIITAETLSILYLLILFFGMLLGEKKPRTSVAFIVCLAVAVIGVVTDFLSVTGPWYNFGGVIGFVVLVSLLVFSVQKRRAVGNKPLVFTVIFFIITYTSVFITLFTGIDSYMYVCMALVMMLVYMILQRGEIESGQMRERIMFEM